MKKKLVFKKITISNLSESELKKVKGGRHSWPSYCPSFCPPCPGW